YAELVAARVKKIKNANPEMSAVAIPVDLVTCSGSGLDPHISKAAAEYQIARIAAATDKSYDEVMAIIKRCTSGKFLGVFGEETVNVLKVNLILDGIL
ncbi:MAG: potassium-transporting ATPase subunit C, partial [Christensenella sp.]